MKITLIATVAVVATLVLSALVSPSLYDPIALMLTAIGAAIAVVDRLR